MPLLRSMNKDSSVVWPKKKDLFLSSNALAFKCNNLELLEELESFLVLIEEIKKLQLLQGSNLNPTGLLSKDVECH
jgi:hypothetical protein